MKVVFVGTKNFNFFADSLMKDFDKVVLTTHNYKLPESIIMTSTVIRVDEVFDFDSKTHKLNKEQCIQYLTKIIDEPSEVRVFCNQEANLDVAEDIREYFHIYDHMKSGVEIFRDKIMMKTTIHNKGLRAPIFTELSQYRYPGDYPELMDKLKGDFIIKPNSSVGSRGVYKIFSESDFLSFIKETENDNCRFEAEEYIRGELYEFDTAVQNGVILYSNVSKYSCPMADLQEGVTLGSIMIERNKEIHQRIYSFGSQCLAALDAFDGCFHMEIFHNVNDELVFLEVAARSPGLMTVPAYHRWEGVNMYDLELLIQCGLPADDFAQPSEGHKSRPSFFIV